MAFNLCRHTPLAGQLIGAIRIEERRLPADGAIEMLYAMRVALWGGHSIWQLALTNRGPHPSSASRSLSRLGLRQG